MPNRISNETMEKMKKKSILTKPSNLSARGVTAEQVKATLTSSMFDGTNSLSSEINRVVDEINEDCMLKEEAEDVIETMVDEKTEELEGRVDDLEDREIIHVGTDEGERVENSLWFQVLEN